MQSAWALIAIVGVLLLRRFEQWRLQRKAAREDAKRPEAWLRRQLDQLHEERKEER